MMINEMFEDNNEDKYNNPKDDNEIPRLSDLRKTKLTLGQINQLRLIQDVRNFELRSSLEDIRNQYGKPPEAAGGGLM